METLTETLRWVQNALFVAVGVWALVHWRRRRDAQTAWLAATFGSLATVVLVGVYTDAVSGSTRSDVLGAVNITIIAFFPYLLVRFLDSFEPLRPLWRAATLVASVLVAAGAWALFDQLPERNAPWTPAGTVWVLLFVGYWFTVLAGVGVRFWRAGRGQPTLARRRMRLLGVGSAVLGLVLLLTGVAGGEPWTPLSIVIRLLGVLSALLFLVGFAPPGTLRAAWRQPEEQRLHEASLGLMTATTREEVGGILAPHVAAVVGARSVAVVDDEEVLAVHGITVAEAGAAMGAGDEVAMDDVAMDDVMEVAFTRGRMLLWTSRYTPFFGTEELTLLERMALLADLALDRTSLLTAERSARDELERTNHELESFVYTASHDLKSPLIAMLGYLDVIRTDHHDELGEQPRWYVERMLANGRYMEALIGDLLELSRIGRRQTDPDLVDANALAANLGEELAARYANATYVVADLPHLWMNPTRARQLLGNLMENAAKYGGQQVTVRVTSTPLPDGGVELRVHDDGPGVPVEYAERVFGVFERLEADENAGGTGIGLAICRKIVEAAGGHIWIEAAETGADFRIRLPADAVRADPPQTARSQEVPA